MYTARLAYGALLLRLLEREVRWRRLTNWVHIEELCDRFERLMATFERPVLVWEGDYA